MKELESEDNFIRKVVKALGLETPSPNFTAKLTARIETYHSQQHYTTYQPLISKKGWIVIAFGILALYGVALTQIESYTWLKTKWALGLTKLSELVLQFLNPISIPGFFLDVTVYFLFLSMVVIVFLKFSINRKLRYNGAS